MNTTVCEIDSNLANAESYYREMLAKSFDAMAKRLHPKVHLISPLTEISGRDTVVEAAKNLSDFLSDIDIRAKFCSGEQIMFAYDFMFPKPIGKLRASVLMNFTDGLISKIELFYDGRPFEEKKDEIFTKK